MTRPALALVLAVLLLAGCATATAPAPEAPAPAPPAAAAPPVAEAGVEAAQPASLHWARTAAEHRAAFLQTFRAASERLEELV